MSSVFYFLLCSLIWSTTWLAIKLQVATVAPEISVFLRFLIATIVLFSFSLLKRRSLRFSIKDHFYLFALGSLQFCLNFQFTYRAEMSLTSGIVAFVFTTVPYLNILWLFFIFRQKIQTPVIIAALIGAAGVFLIFNNELRNFSAGPSKNSGLLFAFSAAFCSSISGLIARRNSLHKLAVIESTAWAMLYGTASSLFLILATSVQFPTTFTSSYFGSLVYLAIFGSVIAYSSYFHLIGLIGVDRAAYVNIVTPALALIISSFFENFMWITTTYIGVGLCLLGNFLILGGRKKSRANY